VNLAAINSPLIWTAIVAAGYPLATILVAELQRRFAETNRDAASVLRLVQITVLPVLALHILMKYVAGLDHNYVSLRIVETVLAITLINVVLAGLNVAMRSATLTADWFARTPGLLLDLVRLFLVLLGAAFVASNIWDVDLGALLTALGVGSVVIGLALQDTLSSLFAGVSIMSGRQFKEGDWLSAGDHEGAIIAMDWRSVTILTEENSVVVIPNSELSGSAFTVQGSQGRTVAEELVIEFPYQVSPASAFAAITEAASSTKAILTKPAFEIELIEMTKETVHYELLFHAAGKEACFKAHADFLRRLWYVCQRHGIELAGQTNRLFRSHMPPTIMRAEDRVKTLVASGLFPDTATGLDKLGAAARYQLYDEGELLLSEGGEFDHVHLILSGTAQVRVHRGAAEVSVQTLSDNMMFLTRAFLTDAPAPATVMAATELGVLAISREDMIEFLNANTGLAGRFERLIDRTENALNGIRPGPALVSATDPMQKSA
jgi:small-conductance mechanosensitive channel